MCCEAPLRLCVVICSPLCSTEIQHILILLQIFNQSKAFNNYTKIAFDPVGPNIYFRRCERSTLWDFTINSLISC